MATGISGQDVILQPFITNRVEVKKRKTATHEYVYRYLFQDISHQHITVSDASLRASLGASMYYYGHGYVLTRTWEYNLENGTCIDTEMHGNYDISPKLLEKSKKKIKRS